MNYRKVRAREAKMKRDGRVAGGAVSRKWLEENGFRNGGAPASLGALRIIEQGLPGFKWREDTVGGSQKILRFEGYPSVRGEWPSLADLVRHVRGEKVLNFDAFASKKVAVAMQSLVNLGTVGTAFAHLLLSLPVALPPVEITSAIARWLSKAISGETVTMVTPVCPDYACDDQGCYTFDSLGTGIGLVARRIMAVLPRLEAFFEKHGLRVNFVIVMADSEADTEANCTRVGLSAEQFRDHARASQAAFAAACNMQADLQLPLVTELTGWYDLMYQAQVAVQAGRYTGAFKLTDEAWRWIVDARAPLYRRWYGEGVDPEHQLLEQIPEYMAMGTVIERSFPSAMIMGADHPAMAVFEQGLGTSVRPIVSLVNAGY